MDPILLVSPHCDDAALGAGEFIASYPGAHVATVCTSAPADTPLTTYDRDSGFATTEHAMRARRAEDVAAMRDLRAVPHHLGLVDSQYLGNVPEAAENIELALRLLLDELQPVRLYTVLGVSPHPDHQAVHAAVSDLAGDYELPLWCFEELPHRVLDPERAVDRAREVGGHLEFVGGDQLPLKQRAVTRYASQRWALNLRCCWTPERFWRMP